MEEFSTGDIVESYPFKETDNYRIKITYCNQTNVFAGTVLETSDQETYTVGTTSGGWLKDSFRLIPDLIDNMLTELDKLEKKCLK